MEHSSIKDLKKRVLGLYRGNWGSAIKANLIPIIMEVFVGFFVTIATLLVALVLSKTGMHMDFKSASDALNSGTAGDSSGLGMRTSWNFLENAIALFILVGIQYGLLDWMRNKEMAPSWKAPFQTFTRKYFGSTLALYVIQFIFLLGWGLLSLVTLGIPYLIKSYSYSQTYLIYKDASDHGKADHFEYVNFITFSRRLMNGNKWRFFLVKLSMVGWYILSLLTFGIGFIWYVPYRNGLYVTFYDDLVQHQGKEKVAEIFE